MVRFFVITLLNLVAMVSLTALTGGVHGVATEAPDPQVDAAPDIVSTEERIVPPLPVPMAFHDAQGLWVSTDPETVKVTDPDSGRSIVVPDFERYHFEARQSRPIDAEGRDHQAVQATWVRVKVYREPETLEEAQAFIDGAPGAKESLVKWLITAPVADAEFLQEGLSLSDRRDRPTLTDTLIVLKEGVRIQDMQDNVVIEGEEIELEPGRSVARGRGRFEVRHPSVTIIGEDLELVRTETSERVHLKKKVVVHLLKELRAKNGDPLLTLGGSEFRPGSISAEGGATILREEAFGRDRLHIVLQDGVHAEQEGGRTLDAERIKILAHRPLPNSAAKIRDEEDWKLSRFEASGGVVLEYPDETEEGTPFLLSLRGKKLIHEVAEDGTAITLLEGQPRIDFHGDIPLQGNAEQQDLGLLRASAIHQASVTTPGPGEIPPGEDPSRYLRIVLSGQARIERRDTGLRREWDRIQGDQLTMLMRRVEVPAAEGRPQSKPREKLLATDFALRGNVRLSGSRMSGMTHRLVGDRLDTDAPVLVAEGPNTSFAFHGLRQGERLLGGHDETTASASPSDATSSEDEQADWVLERLQAGGGLVVRTTFGGPTVGLPARLEGAELVYDRVSDRARLQSAGTTPAQLTIGDASLPRNSIAARTMVLERGNGVIRAQGNVRGTVHVLSDDSMQPGIDALGLGDPEVGSPVTFGVATNGRIEIRGVLSGDERQPELNADQVIRVEGDVVAELTAASTAVDDLHASFLEVRLRRRPNSTTSEATTPLARMAAPRRTGTAVPSENGRGTAPAKRKRWDLEAGLVTARFGETGLERVEAEERARLYGDDGEIIGRRIAYDAKLQEATAEGSGQRQAQAIFGPAGTRNEVWAPRLTLKLGADGPERLVANGPAWAVLMRTEKKATGQTWERFEARCDADVVVTPTELRSDGLVEILRHLRAAPGTPWEAPGRLWADRLVVRGSKMLDRGTAELDRVIASGPSTAFQMGTGEKQTTAWGDRFELDVKTSLATLSGSPRTPLRVSRGPALKPKMVSDQTRIVLDLKTGMFKDLKEVQLILKGGSR